MAVVVSAVVMGAVQSTPGAISVSIKPGKSGLRLIALDLQGQHGAAVAVARVKSSPAENASSGPLPVLGKDVCSPAYNEVAFTTSQFFVVHIQVVRCLHARCNAEFAPDLDIREPDVNPLPRCPRKAGRGSAPAARWRCGAAFFSRFTQRSGTLTRGCPYARRKRDARAIFAIASMKHGVAMFSRWRATAQDPWIRGIAIRN